MPQYVTLPALLSRPVDARHDDVNELFELLYDDLRRIAARHLRGERHDHTLACTALVHEAYVRIADGAELPQLSRLRFRAVVSAAMRRILVDHARRRNAAKRGGGLLMVTLEPGSGAALPRTAELLALDDALSRLGGLDRRLEQVVECRFFGGMTMEETAGALDASLRTVERDWQRAKVYLRELLS
jgi:RNA polymerase sigma-70 factor, ECF subfamily